MFLAFTLEYPRSKVNGRIGHCNGFIFACEISLSWLYPIVWQISCKIPGFRPKTPEFYTLPDDSIALPRVGGRSSEQRVKLSHAPESSIITACIHTSH